MKLNAEKTKELIKESGRSIKEFCEDVGIKNYNMSKYLHGANIPRRALVRIADDLGASTYELMNVQGLHY